MLKASCVLIKKERSCKFHIDFKVHLKLTAKEEIIKNPIWMSVSNGKSLKGRGLRGNPGATC